jgi:hypothetical protein
MAKRKPAAENLSVICDELRSFLEVLLHVLLHDGLPERNASTPNFSMPPSLVQSPRE